MSNRPHTLWCAYCPDTDPIAWPTHIDFCKHFIKEHLHDTPDGSKYPINCHHCIFEYQIEEDHCDQNCDKDCNCENNFDYVFFKHKCTGKTLKLTRLFANLNDEDCDYCAEEKEKSLKVKDTKQKNNAKE